MTFQVSTAATHTYTHVQTLTHSHTHTHSYNDTHLKWQPKIKEEKKQ